MTVAYADGSESRWGKEKDRETDGSVPGGDDPRTGVRRDRCRLPRGRRLRPRVQRGASSSEGVADGARRTSGRRAPRAHLDEEGELSQVVIGHRWVATYVSSRPSRDGRPPRVSPRYFPNHFFLRSS